MEQSIEKSCCLGESLNEECNKLIYTRKTGHFHMDNFTKEDLDLISKRTLYEFKTDDKICYHHEKVYLSRYEMLQNHCFDPYGKHKRKIKKSLQKVALSIADELHMKPGQKLCTNCVKLHEQKHEECINDENVDAIPDTDFYDSKLDISMLNDSATLFGVSPLKTVGKRDRVGYGKQKVTKFKKKIVDLVASAYDIEEADLSTNDVNQCEKCEDLDRLINHMKEKMVVSTRQDQIKILTLVPESWTISKTCNEFAVSKHLVKKARKLKATKGILADPEQKKGNSISEDIKRKVVSVYESDEYSRLCPGKKECVSVYIDGVKIKKQKRLVLLRLKELYLEFKKLYPDIKVGFSKFCEFRPRWCVTVNSSGMHYVCVCSYHQNVKLLCSVIPVKCDYKDLMDLCVCSVNNRNCMFHLCEHCPQRDNLSNTLNQHFEANDYDGNDVISYKQWVSTDRTTLITNQTTVSEFIDTATNMIYDLCHHHFIKEAQSRYLRESKEKLATDTVLILMDFAENYSFILQDAIQGFYWQNNQATLHPFAVYHKDLVSNELVCQSLSVISDHLKHEQTTVHCFIATVLKFIRSSLPHISKVKYFTDGAASQYKNYKALINLMYHENDHKLKAEHHFFATSHGKSPCDGIGGTIKREATHASLRATTNNQIITPKDLYDWAEENIKGVKLFYITSEEVTSHEDQFKLNSRYSMANTVPGTRSYHGFVPQENFTLQLKRISTDVIHNEHKFTQMIDTPDWKDYKPGRYIACMYDDIWYVGLILEYSEENEDFCVKFMSRKGFNLNWISDTRSSQCWVPYKNIICSIDAPEIKGSTAREYCLNKHDYDKIVSMKDNI